MPGPVASHCAHSADPGYHLCQQLADWNCVIWVKEVLEGLKADEKAMSTSALE